MRARPPSPEDVLRALFRLERAGRRVMDRTGSPSAAMQRRTAMAVCRAFGWTLVRIGRAFNRDHSTVVSNLKVYCRNRELGGHEGEETLFRRLVAEALQVAAERRDVARLDDYRQRRAG